MHRRLATPLLMTAAALALAACGSSSPPASTTTTRPADAARALPVTSALKTQLVRAGAALNGLPTTDYVGLVHNNTFYAYDLTTRTYWAGASLDPSPHSERAQIASQDDGGFLLFTRMPPAPWKAYDDGLGTVPGSHCSIVVPAAVRKVWSWSLTTPCGGPR